MKVGDRVRVKRGEKVYEGILMPKSEESIVIKLDNGYNIGFLEKEVEVEVLERGKKFEAKMPKVEVFMNPNLPKISILGTGGTVASKIEYLTGAVYPAFSPSELLMLVPELAEIANISGREVLNIFSEDMNVEYWKKIGREIVKEIEKGAEGILIAHGTDTMAYTSSILSFILKDLRVPVVLVGSQRSSDRPSSDSTFNLLCAARFATTDCGEVVICMHAGLGDDFCHAHRGTKVRKMHTSRRDTFKSINIKPIAKVFPDKVLFLQKYRRKGGETFLDDRIEEKVALVKTYPGISEKVIEFYIDNGYKGVVLEGTGLGHTPTNLVKVFERGKKEGVIFCMTSQCIYGRVNMNVYKTGRLLQKANVIPLEDMLPETALTKLMYVLGHVQEYEEVKKMMLENIAGEITIDTKVFDD